MFKFPGGASWCLQPALREDVSFGTATGTSQVYIQAASVRQALRKWSTGVFSATGWGRGWRLREAKQPLESRRLSQASSVHGTPEETRRFFGLKDTKWIFAFSFYVVDCYQKTKNNNKNKETMQAGFEVSSTLLVWEKVITSEPQSPDSQTVLGRKSALSQPDLNCKL